LGYDLVSKSVNVSQVTVNPAVKIKMKKAEKSGGGLIEDEASIAFLDKGNQLYREGKFDAAMGRDMTAKALAGLGNIMVKARDFKSLWA